MRHEFVTLRRHLTLASGEAVEGNPHSWSVLYPYPLLRKMDRLEPVVKIVDVVGVQEYVVASEPRRPEGAGRPGVANAIRAWMLARDMEDGQSWAKSPLKAPRNGGSAKSSLTSNPVSRRAVFRQTGVCRASLTNL